MPRSRLLPANKETASSIQPPFFDAFFWSLRFGSVCVALSWDRLLFGFLGVPPSVLVNGLCDISTMGDARVGRWSIRGARGSGYRRGCAVARGGARGDDSARRQKSRCAGEKGSDALAPVARAPSGIGASHVLVKYTASPAVPPRLLVLLFGRFGTAFGRSRGKVSAGFSCSLAESSNDFSNRFSFATEVSRQA